MRDVIGILVSILTLPFLPKLSRFNQRTLRDVVYSGNKGMQIIVTITSSKVIIYL